MSRFYRFTLLIALVIATLACGLITGPIDQAKNLASTAEAVASSMPIETLQALPSAMPSGMPNIPGLPNIPGMSQMTGCLQVSGSASESWKGIPVMPGASAGQELSSGLYCFKTSAAVADIKQFYQDHLSSLGWSSLTASPEVGGVSTFIYQKDSQILTIIITHQGQDTVVMLQLQ